MSEQKKIDVIKRYSEKVMNRGSLDAVDELLADDYVHHSPPPGMAPTREGFKQFVAAAHTGLDDLTLTTDDILADGDTVVQRWTNSGMHDGEFLGVPPTGNRVRFSGVSIYTVRDGKIIEDWTYFDTMDLLQQLDAAPQPA
jgi:steroid delta-isomerase-like uncharacterized protein